MEKIKNALQQLGKWFDNRKAAVLMAAAFVIMLIPMFIVARYSHASADDFGWNAAMRRQVWNETHSMWQLIKTAVHNTVSMYYGWQGTFTTTFVQAFQPEIFNVRAYFIVPYLMMAFFFGGSALFLYYVLVRLLNIDRMVYLVVTFLYFIVTVQYIPSTGEAFYWFNGAVAYTLPYAGVLFGLYFALKYIFEKKKRYLALSCFCAFFVGGGNYLTIVLLPLLFALLMFLFTGKRRNTLWLLLPLSIFLVTAVINMKAPGTVVRGGDGFGFDLAKVFHTVGRAVYNGMKGVLTDYLSNPVIVICFLLIALFLIRDMAGKQYGFSFRHPLLFVGMTFGSYLAMYAPTYYAGVGAPFGRMSNLISFWFELGLILDIVYITGFIGRVVRQRGEKAPAVYKSLEDRSDRMCKAWDTYKIYVLIAAILLIAVNPGWYRMSAFSRTVRYLASGEAAQFGREMDERYALLLDEGKKDVIIEPLSVSAGPLFLYDIVEEPEEWPNTAVAEFFGKDSVRLAPKETGQ